MGMLKFLNREMIPLSETDILQHIKDRVCINEMGHINCTRFITDLSNLLDLPIISYYDTPEIYSILKEDTLETRCIKGNNNNNNNENEKNKEEKYIIDDAYTLRVLKNNKSKKPVIDVYRSDSLSNHMRFEYDLCIDVMPLGSGRSDVLDGKIVRRRRDQVLFE